jgi:hypothetical protein
MSNSPRRVDPAIIAALIGVCGTITVTLITLYASRMPVGLATPTFVLPSAIVYTETATITYTPMITDTAVPTDTVPVGESTSTPAPPTETLTPSITPIPPVPLGADWPAGCISTLWRPYPSNVPALPSGNGCWQEPLHVFSAENGDLNLLAERASGGNDFYGLFAPLPESGSVSIRVKLSQFDNVDLLMGVYAEPDLLNINAPALLMIIPHERLNKLRIVQKDNAISYNTIQGTGTLDQGDGFSITFTFTPDSAGSTVNPNVFVASPVSMPSTQKWLFLGFKGLPGSYRLEGRFFALELR